MERYLQAGDVITLRGIDGRYTIRDIIGRGSSCVVYAATFCNANGEVTEHLLKEYNPRHLELTRDGMLLRHRPEDDAAFEEWQERFERGFARQAALRTIPELKNYTANVQNIYHDHGTVYVDMTATAGVSYAEVSEASLYDLARRLRVVAQVIGIYHGQGFLHLDIKPSNLFVRPAGETREDVLLFDFDSLVPFREENGRCVLDGDVTLSYTTEYAPVELLSASRRGRIGKVTDIYEIGEILFEKVMGRHSTTTEHNTWATYPYDVNSPLFENVDPKAMTVLDEIFHHTLCAASSRYASAAELIEQLERLEELTRPEQPYLLSSLPAVSGYFTGRDAEIRTLHDLLTHNNVVFVNGFGGIGKSELVKHYADVHRADYDTVIFAPFIHDVSLLITSDTYVPIAHCAPFDEETPQAYFERKLNLFRTLCDERTLLIVDNLDAVEDERLADLWTLGCKLLVTSRLDMTAVYAGVPQLSVGPLTDPLAVFYAHYQKVLSEQDRQAVEQIVQAVDGHTMMVELLAKQMTAGHTTPQRMLEKLTHGGIGESGAEKVLHADAHGNLHHDNTAAHLQALFDLSGLADEERYILTNLALLPHIGVPAERVGQWCRLDTFDTFNTLVNDGWIRWDAETDCVALHPVVADLFVDRYVTAESVGTMIRTVSELLSETYFPPEDVAFYPAVLLGMLKMLARTNVQSEDVATFCFRAGEFLFQHTTDALLAIHTMESALTWLQEYPRHENAVLFVLYVGIFINALQRQQSLLTPAEAEVKIAHWQKIAEAENNALDEAADEDDVDWDSLSTEEAIVAAAQLRTRYTVTQDTYRANECSKLVVRLYRLLSESEIRAIQASGDCQVLFQVACAYNQLKKPKKAIPLYRMVIDNEREEPLRVEGAYMAILGMYSARDDYENGLPLCHEFHAFLTAQYAPEHKIFTTVYSFLFIFSCLRLFALGKRKKLRTIAPQEVLDVLAYGEAYHRLQERYGAQFYPFPYEAVPHLAVYACEYLRIAFLGEYKWADPIAATDRDTALTVIYSTRCLLDAVRDHVDTTNAEEILDTILAFLAPQ